MEVLEELENPCLSLLNQDFLEGRMELGIKNSIIKPIPKQVACSQLKHWRPILMVFVIYKLMAKMLAIKMTPILGDIVSQHGSIKGRSIYDNILAVMAGMEYALFKK